MTVTGRVEDLASWYDRARVFVAPSRIAAGIPLKVLEAAANGIPAVVTPPLAAQLGWTPGEELLVGETPDAIAEAVLRLYSGESLWSGLQSRALARVSGEHGMEAMKRALSAIVE